MKGLCNYMGLGFRLHLDPIYTFSLTLPPVFERPRGSPDAVYGTLIRIPSGFALNIRMNAQSYGHIGCTFSTQNHGNNSILA